MTRLNIKRILTNPTLRRELMIDCLIATQAREGIETTREQAERAYDAVQARRSRRKPGEHAACAGFVTCVENLMDYRIPSCKSRRGKGRRT